MNVVRPRDQILLVELDPPVPLAPTRRAHLPRVPLPPRLEHASSWVDVPHQPQPLPLRSPPVHPPRNRMVDHRPRPLHPRWPPRWVHDRLRRRIGLERPEQVALLAHSPPLRPPPRPRLARIDTPRAGSAFTRTPRSPTLAPWNPSPSPSALTASITPSSPAPVRSASSAATTAPTTPSSSSTPPQLPASPMGPNSPPVRATPKPANGENSAGPM